MSTCVCVCIHVYKYIPMVVLLHRARAVSRTNLVNVHLLDIQHYRSVIYGSHYCISPFVSSFRKIYYGQTSFAPKNLPLPLLYTLLLPLLPLFFSIYIQFLPFALGRETSVRYYNPLLYKKHGLQAVYIRHKRVERGGAISTADK